tara:strand:- start:1189 stop:2769 length:1581 start_codon:yes stop_codon:yes gene_type:complete
MIEHLFSSLFFILLISFSGISQGPEISWGQLERKQGTLLYILPSAKNEFYALRWSGGRVFGHYKASKHSELKSIESSKIKLVANGSMANFEGAKVFNDRFVTFLSDRQDGKNVFYMQPFNSALEADGEPLSLASYDFTQNRGKGFFDIKISANGKYIGVVWQIPGKKGERHIYGFKVFNQDFELINDGEYRLPFSSELSEIHEHHISNTGDYFLCLSEYVQVEKKKLFTSNIEFKALHIYHITDDDGLQDFTLDLDGKRITAMAMYSDKDDLFVLTGIYGNKDQTGVSGVFHQRVNLKTEEILKEGFKEFDEEFITQGWSERELRKASKREERGKGGAQLYNYKMRDVTFLEDGSIIGTMEQYYVQVQSNMDGRTGQSSNVYMYYYNDIIAYKIDTEGEFNWVDKIRKYQVSINDGGPYSSFESFVDSGSVYFIFNDHMRNYTDAGSFIDEERIHTANYGRKRNAIALASINLTTGEVSRETFTDGTKNKALVVPKLFSVNPRTGELWLYSVSGRKEKFGRLNYSP